MAQTANLKLVTPDASSVLIPLHSHFAVLASGVDEAITNRFQYKILSFETTAARDLVYSNTTGLVIDSTNKPALVDGDVCYVRDLKRYFIWNNNGGTSAWILTLKRFNFPTLTDRDAMPAVDIAEGDTCYVADIDVNYTWDGTYWYPTSQQSTLRKMETGYTYVPQFSGSILTGTFANSTTFATPILITNTLTVTSMSINVVTASTGSSQLTLGVYSNATSGLDYPATRLLSTSTIIATTTGVKTLPGLSLVLQPGIYWLSLSSNNGGGTDPTISRFSQSPFMPMSTTSSIQFLGNAAWSMSGTTPPATWSTTKTLAQYGPLISIGV